MTSNRAAKNRPFVQVLRENLGSFLFCTVVNEVMRSVFVPVSVNQSGRTTLNNSDVACELSNFFASIGKNLKIDSPIFFMQSMTRKKSEEKQMPKCDTSVITIFHVFLSFCAVCS